MLGKLEKRSISEPVLRKMACKRIKGLGLFMRGMSNQ